MVEATNNSYRTINHTQMLQLTMAIAAVSCSWFALGGDAGLAHEHHHSGHRHNHWQMITKDLGNWPPSCEGELVDEGITHAHALLSANRELVQANPDLQEWIMNDANQYDPDMVHVNTRADLEAAVFHVYESHFFTCYSLVYDEDGE